MAEKRESALMVLAVVFTQLVIASPYGSMSTLGAMWGGYSRNVSDDRSPDQNSYAVCVLQAGTLTPNCSGSYQGNDQAVVPSDRKPLFALVSGAYFSCGLLYESRFPICWGYANATVPPWYQTVSYSTISAGKFHVCALTKDGRADCWGEGVSGETKAPADQTFTYLAAGWGFTYGLTGEGKPLGWGDVFWNKPALSFDAISAGNSHVCGIEKNTHKAFCWGSDDFNQSTPPTNYTFSSIASGSYHSCGIRKDNGRVVCWGDDAFRQRRDTPAEESFSVIAAGDFYTCGVSLNQMQHVKCWGNSVVYTGINTKVSQGLCVSKCGSKQYRLPDNVGGLSRQCPSPGDRVCLDCTEECVDGIILAPCKCSNSSKVSGSPVDAGAKGINVGVVVGVVITGLVFLGASAAVGVVYCCKRKWHHPAEPHTDWSPESPLQACENLVAFKSSELVLATKNYSEDMIVGKGSFGVVYKGVLPNGQVLAIKRAQLGGDTGKSFAKELELLGRLHHTYLIKLVGYCAEKRLLAYEFMDNGSLFDCLFNKKPDLRLDCAQRIRIAAQAARGLEYLHTYASPQIIHRDVKTSNILLDKDWTAHISDFGLSLLGPPKNVTHLSGMTVVGTPGYLDPEYWQTMQLTVKSDVYSFGVVLLELLTGRKAILSESQQTIIAWVVQRVEQDAIDMVFDPSMKFAENSAVLQSVLQLALDCINLRGKDRPGMGFVANYLEEELNNMSETPMGRSSSNFTAGSSSESVQVFGSLRIPHVR